jgi:hypothetical protein
MLPKDKLFAILQGTAFGEPRRKKSDAVGDLGKASQFSNAANA